MLLLSSTAPPARRRSWSGGGTRRSGPGDAGGRRAAVRGRRGADRRPGAGRVQHRGRAVRAGRVPRRRVALRPRHSTTGPPRRTGGRRRLYNRGVCLVKRATDVPALRTAVIVLRAGTRRGCPARGTLRADARYNLELAKLLWAEARARQGTRTTPNDLPPEEPPETKPPRTTERPRRSQPGGAATQAGHAAAGGERSCRRGGPAADRSERPPGPGRCLCWRTARSPQKLSPEDARRHLRRVAERLDRDRRANARLLGRAGAAACAGLVSAKPTDGYPWALRFCFCLRRGRAAQEPGPGGRPAAVSTGTEHFYNAVGRGCDGRVVGRPDRSSGRR